jgi:hypothetical protein
MISPTAVGAQRVEPVPHDTQEARCLSHSMMTRARSR